MTVRQVIAFREVFNDPAWVLTRPTKRQCQERNAEAEGRAEKRRVLTKPAPDPFIPPPLAHVSRVPYMQPFSTFLCSPRGRAFEPLSQGNPLRSISAISATALQQMLRVSAPTCTNWLSPAAAVPRSSGGCTPLLLPVAPPLRHNVDPRIQVRLGSPELLPRPSLLAPRRRESLRFNFGPVHCCFCSCSVTTAGFNISFTTYVCIYVWTSLAATSLEERADLCSCLALPYPHTTMGVSCGGVCRHLPTGFHPPRPCYSASNQSRYAPLRALITYFRLPLQASPRHPSPTRSFSGHSILFYLVAIPSTPGLARWHQNM